MFGLFKNVKVAFVEEAPQEIPAEVIHAEVDAAEDKFLQQIKAILDSKAGQEVKIADNEQRKANLLGELGFTNNQLIQDVKAKEQVNIRLAEEAKLLNETVDLFQKYKSAYPLEKVMPLKDFEAVLKKYNLIYAPAQSYIKDVPEKNLLEIKNAKSVEKNHGMLPIYEVTNVSLRYNAPESTKSKVERMLNSDNSLRFHYTNYEVRELKEVEFLKENISVDASTRYTPRGSLYESDTYRDLDWKTTSSVNKFFEGYSGIKELKSFNLFLSATYSVSIIIEELIKKGYNYVNVKKSEYLAEEHKSDVEKLLLNKLNKEISSHIQGVTLSPISREKLFIAAPKSHFDLDGLAKITGYGYYATNSKQVKVTITKDPIAFQFLQGNEQYPDGFVRILSKWGTEDDKSYLDPSVQHGIHN